MSAICVCCERVWAPAPAVSVSAYCPDCSPGCPCSAPAAACDYIPIALCLVAYGPGAPR